jgi:hypothetical protein
MHQSKQQSIQFRRHALAAAALLLIGGSAIADSGDKMFSISGFGTVGAAHSSLEHGDYVADLFQPKGAGYSGSWSESVDSKLAAQLDGKFGYGLSMVVQVVAAPRTNGRFSPRVEWANLKYDITSDLSVRAGRTALPSFQNAETRLVGYANPWVRPPVETYSQFTISNSDGIDASYRYAVGPTTNRLQAWYGKTEVDAIGTTGNVTRGIQATKIKGVANTVEYGALSARAGIMFTNIELQAAPGLFLKPLSTIINFGATYDPGQWFIQGEVTHSKLGTISRAQLATYVTAGYRWNSLTPYIGHSRVKSDDDLVKLTLREQKTTSLGVRWDFRKNMDLKVQLDRVSLANGSAGFFTNVKPGLTGSSGNVASVAVDFIY